MMKDRAILLEVLRNRLKAISEEMAAVTLRTGFTVFVKETSDFGAACVAPRRGRGRPGRHGRQPDGRHPRRGAALSRQLGEDEGDIGISNDAHAKGLSTHLPDIWLWKPIFSQGEVVGFGFNFIHSSDIGGRVPGSISPANTDIFQDGLRIPVLKLFEHGALNESFRRIFLANCRIPHTNWGTSRRRSPR